MAKFFERGEVYRKKKPVYWCINCTTALAEAEIEYETDTSTSIYVKFPLISRDAALEGYPDKPIFMLIWTTTPWTLPANLAIAVNPEFTYVAVETNDEVYIAVKDLVADIMGKAGIADWRIIGEISPDDAEGTFLQASFYRQEVRRRLRRLCGQGRGHGRGPHRPGSWGRGLCDGPRIRPRRLFAGERERRADAGRGILRRAERLRCQPRDHTEAEGPQGPALLGRDRALLPPLLEVQEARHLQGDRTVVRLDGQGRAAACGRSKR